MFKKGILIVESPVYGIHPTRFYVNINVRENTLEMRYTWESGIRAHIRMHIHTSIHISAVIQYFNKI